MSTAETKIISRLNILSIVGPAFVIASLLLLVVRESTFLIDLSATAVVGLVLCWRAKELGFLTATALLSSVLSYEYFFAGELLSLWELGLSASIEMAFFVTTLASLELFEAFHSIGQRAFAQVAQWETKISEVVSEKGRLEVTLADLQKQLLASAEQVKTQIERAEHFEKLVSIARDEMLEQTHLRHTYEAASISTQLNVNRLHEEIENLTESLAFQKTAHAAPLAKLEKEIQRLTREKEELQSSLSQSQTLATQLNKDKQQVEFRYEALSNQLQHKTAEYEKIAALNESLGIQIKQKTELLLGAEGKLLDLSDQLGKLTDRLKGLQSEKDELEKALDEALKPVEDPAIKESQAVRRVEGLYQQLRAQFVEKNQVLADTRRELFHTEEKLQALQRDYAEATLFAPSELGTHTMHVHVLQNEIKAQQAEIEQLEDVLTALVKELTAHGK